MTRHGRPPEQLYVEPVYLDMEVSVRSLLGSQVMRVIALIMMLVCLVVGVEVEVLVAMVMTEC
jgi:hypothetical protein